MKTRVNTLHGSPGLALASVVPGEVEQQVADSGAVLLRGFHWDLESFERFSRKLCRRFYRIASRERLPQGQSDGFTARAPESNITLLAHSEASYRPFAEPELAFFACLAAPVEQGGEGLIVDGREFVRRMPDALRARFEDEGVIFESRWEPPRWQAEFETDSRDQLEEIRQRYPSLEWRFEGDIMHYRCRRSAIQADAAGAKVFCNAILAHLPQVPHPRYRDARAYALETNQVRFGDGEPLSAAVINQLIDTQDAVAFENRLADGDVLVLDNSRVMHGRRPLERDCARVLLTRFGYRQA